MSAEFINALERVDITKVKRVPKGDLHNHAPRGGNIAYIEKWAGVKIKRLDYRFNDLNEMQEWYDKNVKCHCKGKDGYEIRIRAAFEQAKMDGISKLVLTFGFGEETQIGSFSDYVKKINEMHKEIAPEIEFIPEFAVGSGVDVQSVYHLCEEYFSHGFYKSIDINGTEIPQNFPEFKPLYRLAKSHGMKLRAHVGEFCNADSVREAVETLELDEVQHGIAAAECPSTMRWLADNKIQLNICPASNIFLKRAEDYKSHPIRKLFDEGVKVTINTDDMLIFDVGVSEMFMKFYTEKVFSAQELDIIRQYSLS